MFLFTNSTQSEREFKKTIPFRMASKRVNYLRINLTKEIKDLCTESCKTLMREIEEYTNEWNGIRCSWVGRINVIEMSILPKDRQI